MKRAILVTTGTVVGVASVLSYKPHTTALALIPGTESLTTSSRVSTQGALNRGSASATPSTSSEDVSGSASPEAAAGSEDTPSTASTAGAQANTKATASATTSARATTTPTPRASASTSGSTSSTPTAAPSPTASASSSSAAAGALQNGTFTGPSEIVEHNGRTYGTLVATVSVSDGKMTSISFVQTPGGRNEQFISAVNQYLVPEIIRTQNIKVGIVSGATGTSMALIYSLQSALGQ